MIARSHQYCGLGNCVTQWQLYILGVWIGPSVIAGMLQPNDDIELAYQY